MSPDARERRVRRARLAQRVLAGAPDAASSLDWDALDSAPPWLSLPEPQLAAVQRRLGALLCAPALQLWIDRPRVNAARAAVGAAFWQAALAHTGAAWLPVVVLAQLSLATADQVTALLRGAGGAVLLASLPHGALQRVAQAVLAPVSAIDVQPQAARELLAALPALCAQEESS